MDTSTHFGRIRQALEEQITSGVFPAGARLPAERLLSERFQTTRVTVREALNSLEQDGIIYREDRRGWFVAPPRLVYNPTKNANFHQMAAEQGYAPDTSLIEAHRIPSTPQIQEMLGLPPLSQVYRLRRLRSIDQRVVLFVENYIRADYFPDLLDHDLSQSLATLYQERYQTVYQHVAFQLYPVALPEQAASQLKVTRGSAGLLISRVNRDQSNRIIDCDFEYWRHYALVVQAETTNRP